MLFTHRHTCSHVRRQAFCSRRSPRIGESGLQIVNPFYVEPDFFKKINLFTNQKPTYRNIENKLIVTKGEMWRGRINQELGMNIYTLLHII